MLYWIYILMFSNCVPKISRHLKLEITVTLENVDLGLSLFMDSGGWRFIFCSDICYLNSISLKSRIIEKKSGVHLQKWSEFGGGDFFNLTNQIPKQFFSFGA